MPMGACLSSDVYQYKVDGHLEGIKNCTAIADDIIMYGFREDGSDIDETVIKVMEIAKKVGMRFNPSKCQFKHQPGKLWPDFDSRWYSPRPIKDNGT